jgi:integral membrane protein
MTSTRWLRLLSWIEGVSFLFLLVVAMPLKHLMGVHQAVSIAGGVHGLLFLALLSAAFRAAVERVLPWRAILSVLAWSLVPFGYLASDKTLRCPPAR